MHLSNIFMLSINFSFALVGSILNVLALYCFWRIKRQNGNLGNSDKLTLVLNIGDTVYCVIFLPVKVITYVLNPSYTVRPLHFSFIDSINFVFSSLTISLIAFNRFLKIAKSSKYHLILPTRRLHVLLFMTIFVSVFISTLIFVNSRVAANLAAIVLISTIILLVVFYTLIRKKMNSSRIRVNTSIANSTNSYSPTELRLVRIVLILISAYFCCCICLFVMLLNHVISPSQQNRELIKIGVWAMALNSLINPVIYALRTPSYQRIIKKLFRLNRVDIDGEINPNQQNT